MNQFINDLNELKNETSKILHEKRLQLDSYDINALLFIISYLEQIINECKTGQLKPKNQRYPHIARIIIDNNISLITPDLGGRLIEAEKKYIDQL